MFILYTYFINSARKQYNIQISGYIYNYGVYIHTHTKQINNYTENIGMYEYVCFIRYTRESSLKATFKLTLFLS